jgi:hypothetical protein
MPEVISCPKCDRKLNVPAENFGKLAQCPVCRFTFTAQPPSSEPPPPAPIRPVVRVEEEEPPPPARGGWFDEVTRKRRESEAGDGDLNFGDDYTGAGRPHRGGSILMLAILGLVLACIPFVGGTLGLIAVAMASSDLQEMNRRRMDRSGQGVTQAGQVFAVIAIVINVLVTLFTCMGGFRRW